MPKTSFSLFIVIALINCNSSKSYSSLDRTPTLTEAKVVEYKASVEWPYYYWSAGEQVDTIYGKIIDFQFLDEEGEEIRTVAFKFNDETNYPIDFETIEIGKMYEIEISKYLLLGQHDTTDARNFYSIISPDEE